MAKFEQLLDSVKQALMKDPELYVDNIALKLDKPSISLIEKELAKKGFKDFSIKGTGSDAIVLQDASKPELVIRIANKFILSDSYYQLPAKNISTGAKNATVTISPTAEEISPTEAKKAEKAILVGMAKEQSVNTITDREPTAFMRYDGKIFVADLTAVKRADGNYFKEAAKLTRKDTPPAYKPSGYQEAHREFSKSLQKNGIV